MSTDYSVDLAEALSELVTIAICGESGGGGDEPGGNHSSSTGRSTPQIRLSVVDGEFSLTGAEDAGQGTLSFRGRKCVAEAFCPPAKDDVRCLVEPADELPGPREGGLSASQVAEWIRTATAATKGSRYADSFYASDAAGNPLRIEPYSDDEEYCCCYKSEGDGDASDASDDVCPEDFFYTSQCPDINQLRSLSIANRWTEMEFVVSEDAGDVDKLTDEELDFYRFLFVFLSAADDLVNFNLGNLSALFKQKDILHYYVEQESIEAVHARVYSLIQLMLFRNNGAARAEYVRRSVSDPAIVAKIRWLDTKVAECKSVAEKYVLMMIIEGLFFSSAFASIAYLRTNNLFTVTCQLNTLISRDEAVHTTASCIIYNRYLTEHAKPSARRVHTLFKEAVAVECEFLRCRAPARSTILNLDAIYSYVRFSADRILGLIGLPAVYDEAPPAANFPMGLMITVDNTNFFERRSTAYSGCVTNDL